MDIQTASETPRLARAATRTFGKLATVWELTDDEQQLLVGVPLADIAAWRKTPVDQVSPATFERISLLIGMHISVGRLFPHMPPKWVGMCMRRSDPAFRLTKGESLLSYMLNGGAPAMWDVRSFLVTETGGEFDADDRRVLEAIPISQRDAL